MDDMEALFGPGYSSAAIVPEALPSGVVRKAKAKQRVLFDLTRSFHDLVRVLKRPPKPDECFKLLSDAGGWSSCSLLMWLAGKAVIHELYISTFRVGVKEIQHIDRLHKSRRILAAQFVLSGLVEWDDERASSKYDYYQLFREVCERNGWPYVSAKNHSKVILARTVRDWYVVETSSNFNENPKIEQFSLENDQELFEFYKRNLFERVRGEADGDRE